MAREKSILKSAGQADAMHGVGIDPIHEMGKRLGLPDMRMPVDDLLSNWVYTVITAQAWNIKSWFGLMMHVKADRSAVIRMAFRRFLRPFILVPGRVVRRSRPIIIRVIGYLPAFDRVFSAWHTVQHQQPG